MDNKEYFNEAAFNWDNMVRHDDTKLKKIFELSDVAPDSRILDVGTGTGILIKYLLETSPESITALDISENMIKVAMSKYKDERIKFTVGDLYEHNDGGYDYIFMYSVYPHFEDKDALFKHLSSILNHGGRVVIAHSESKEKINEIHSKNPAVNRHLLSPASVTAEIMSKYLMVEKIIDDNEMYYISAVKTV